MWDRTLGTDRTVLSAGRQTGKVPKEEKCVEEEKWG